MERTLNPLHLPITYKSYILLLVLHQVVDVSNHLIGLAEGFEMLCQTYYATNDTSHSSRNKKSFCII